MSIRQSEWCPAPTDKPLRQPREKSQIRRILRATRESADAKVVRMALAQIGPLTTLFEATATAVGAGVLLGSVVMGVVGLALGWSRADIGNRAVTDGYIGGVIGAGVALTDILIRYGG